MSDSRLRYVRFANFCIDHNVKPYDAARLVELADRAGSANGRNANEGTDKSSKLNNKAQDNFETFVGALGFDVTWSGLYPTLVRNGVDVNIPYTS